jgi:hypothetical protein
MRVTRLPETEQKLKTCMNKEKKREENNLQNVIESWKISTPG